MRRIFFFFWKNKLTKKTIIILTARLVGPTWEVRHCLRGPPDRNSSPGVICQNPTGGSLDTHPWTRLSLFSIAYWYLSSTYTYHCHTPPPRTTRRLIRWRKGFSRTRKCMVTKCLLRLGTRAPLGPQVEQPLGKPRLGLWVVLCPREGASTFAYCLLWPCT